MRGEELALDQPPLPRLHFRLVLLLAPSLLALFSLLLGSRDVKLHLTSISHVAMSLSAGQLFAISATERACSTISLAATSIIVVSFLSSHSFRKPINRLVFYASFGNIMANVATLVSQSGIAAGTNSNLCHIQAFLIQWFVHAALGYTLGC